MIEMKETKGSPIQSPIRRIPESLDFSDHRHSENQQPSAIGSSKKYSYSSEWLSPHFSESLPGTPSASRPSTPTSNSYGNGFISRSQQSLATLLGSTRQTASPLKESSPSATVIHLNDRDDVDIWKGWKRHLFRLIPVLAFGNSALYIAYLALRIYCVIAAQKTYNSIYAGAWVFISIELAIAIPSQMHNFWTMWALKSRNRPKLRLIGNDVPAVDVFVTCCGEEDQVVLDTVRAACDLDYPYDRYRVIVLDDGQSANLKSAVNELATMQPNLLYMAREKFPGVPHHFKAGNLNYGLDQVHLLPGGAGEFMAALDADMIPEREWLRATVAHLAIDPKMALVCPPQLFYNTPKSDPLAQSLNFFVHVIEPIKDALGVAWCTGSGYVARREALDDIGNFPLGSLAEDVATSTMMLGKGWKTGYIHEPLQYGTVPEDFGGHLKQRTRWAIGTIQTAIKLNFCLWGSSVKKMTLAQRFSGGLYATLGMTTVFVTASLLAIPVVLLWGKPLIAYSSAEQLRWLIRACFASTIFGRICEFVLFIPAGYHSGQRDFRYQIWMSPYLALCIVRAFLLPTWLGGQAVAFKPTGSLGSALNERDPALKKNMLRRLWAILFNFMAGFHFLYVYVTLVAVVLTSYRCFFADFDTKQIIVCLITHAFWPPLTFLFICTSLWTPVSYAIDPPIMPDREELLIRDHKTGVAHPKPKSKKIGFGGQAAMFELQHSAATIYTCLVFAYSFWL
ncbi:putative glycosyl transferase [Calycina marina]|uniref:Glycosyl transferase n=1 Tax=Calycina marina TaxID=1763456 RepID=A0A9P7Z879_9HELO|nr:putative glycosyl transferase [Calycina marina]